MTGAGVRASLPAMRALLIPSALVAAFIAMPAAAASGCAAPATPDATPLVPIVVNALPSWTMPVPTAAAALSPAPPTTTVSVDRPVLAANSELIVPVTSGDS